MESSQPNNSQEPVADSTPVSNQPGAPPVVDGIQPPKAQETVSSPPSAPSAALGGTAQAIPVSTAPAPELEGPPLAPPEDAAKPKQAKLLTAHARSDKPIGAIIGAIIIAVSIAGLTVFVYLKTKNSDNKPASSSTSKSPQASSVTPAEIDKTAQDLDKSLQDIDDSADFAESDLSDSTLGL